MEGYLKIGELAKLTGITIRTLHYYDEVGLLKPIQVTESGHRLYGSESFSELYLIIAMKDMGFSLEEIKDFTASKDIDLLELIETQLFRVQEELARKQLLFGKLLKLKQSIKENAGLSAVDFQEILQYINTSVDEYLTKEQLNKLKFNNESFNAGNSSVNEWMAFITDLEYCFKKNLPKTHPSAVKCIDYWKKMTTQLTGNDKQLQKAILAFHSNEESNKLKYGLTDELYRYLMSMMNHKE